MQSTREIYTTSALLSLPRLLSLQDRNPLSPTYGCFHRDYWLYKTSDFADAVRQFGVHALALAYAHPLPGSGDRDEARGPQPEVRSPRPEAASPYYRNPQVRDWAIAGLRFWTKIQHADGSFDEFYPYERGWVGPSAFTTYASASSLALLRAEMSLEDIARVEGAIRRAAQFIAAGDTEEDHLANHHAMAVLALTVAADVLNDSRLHAAAAERFQILLQRYHHPEGWSLEYDGADPGYLSATVSFLGKVYAKKKVPGTFFGTLRAVLSRAIDFASYFVYPDGSYGGTIGSRNTLHFYPHGFELLAPEFPLAASVADRMARALADGSLVPPHIMSDRYVHYRVPEYLLTAIDASPRPAVLTQLPYERPAFSVTFPGAGIAVARHGPAYTVANLAKGGVVKSYRADTGDLVLTDTGWLGELADGTLVTSQWMEHDARTQVRAASWTVDGHLRIVPPPRLFTVPTHLVFRAALLALGWYAPAAHWLKGRIRKSLILDSHPLACAFTRAIELAEDRLTVTDELTNGAGLRFRRLLLGGDHAVRYVPQSRFFQLPELTAQGRWLTATELAHLNAGRPLHVTRTMALHEAAPAPASAVTAVTAIPRVRPGGQ